MIGDVISAYDDVFVSRNGYASFIQAIVLGVIMSFLWKFNIYKGNAKGKKN